jgi:hypothetical protein
MIGFNAGASLLGVLKAAVELTIGWRKTAYLSGSPRFANKRFDLDLVENPGGSIKSCYIRASQNPKMLVRFADMARTQAFLSGRPSNSLILLVKPA